MIKPDSLRAALVAAAPVLASNPDTLRMWVERGKIVCRNGASLHHEYRYTLSVVIIGWTGPADALILAINRWLLTQQPDLLSAGRDETFSFDVDIIDSSTIDLALELQLSEAVSVMDAGGGQFELTYLPEQSPLFAEAVLDPPPVPLTSIWFQGQQLIPAGDG